MATERLGDITLGQLREIIRQEIIKQSQPVIKGDLSDFPVDDLGPWPDDLTLRREDMYGDDER